MANITHGMNPEEVDRLGEDLKRIAREIGEKVREIESKIGSTSWVGPDARRFKDEWWPGHRSNLKKMQTELDGFGQSAKNNASEQREVSRR